MVSDVSFQLHLSLTFNDLGRAVQAIPPAGERHSLLFSSALRDVTTLQLALQITPGIKTQLMFKLKFVFLSQTRCGKL